MNKVQFLIFCLFSFVYSTTRYRIREVAVMRLLLTLALKNNNCDTNGGGQLCRKRNPYKDKKLFQSPTLPHDCIVWYFILSVLLIPIAGIIQSNVDFV